MLNYSLLVNSGRNRHYVFSAKRDAYDQRVHEGKDMNHTQNMLSNGVAGLHPSFFTPANRWYLTLPIYPDICFMCNKKPIM